MFKRNKTKPASATPTAQAEPPRVIPRATPVSLDEAKTWAGIPADIYLTDDSIAVMGIKGNQQKLTPGEYKGTIYNDAPIVIARVEGRSIGNLTDRAIPDAVSVLRAAGGQEARVVITVTERQTAYARARIL